MCRLNTDSKIYIYMSEDTQKMPQSRSTVLLRRQRKERCGTKKRQNEHYTWNHWRTNKEELQQRNCLGTVIGKLLGMRELKLVLLARNLTLNSDTAPLYKYIYLTIFLIPFVEMAYMLCPVLHFSVKFYTNKLLFKPGSNVSAEMCIVLYVAKKVRDICMYGEIKEN